VHPVAQLLDQLSVRIDFSLKVSVLGSPSEITLTHTNTPPFPFSKRDILARAGQFGCLARVNASFK
jgi:hypothetical protein